MGKQQICKMGSNEYLNFGSKNAVKTKKLDFSDFGLTDIGSIDNRFKKMCGEDLYDESFVYNPKDYCKNKSILTQKDDQNSKTVDKTIEIDDIECLIIEEI